MATYNVQINIFSDGSTVFDAQDTGVHVEPANTIGGPDVLLRMEENQAGAIIDLDGTGAAALVPPILTFNFRFVATSPAGHTQYQNLVNLKGKHGTFYGRLYSLGSYATYTAPARLIEVTGYARGFQKNAAESFLVVTAKWQLKDFLA